MSTVVPKLLYSPARSRDIPVWEITTPGGDKIYYERIHYPGLRPVGQEVFKLGNSHLGVSENVRTSGNHMPLVLRAKSGYVAPASWYETDPYYNGPHPAVRLQDLDPKKSNDTQDTKDENYSGDDYSGEYYSDEEFM